MIYLQLFLTFFKIGILSFGGGYAMIPMIQQFVVHEEMWLSMSEMTDLISISQMTPGPIAVNSATFVGTKIAGIPGSVFATLGVITPSLILVSILGKLVFSGRDIRFMEYILNGIRPGVIGLILIAAIMMFKESVWNLQDGLQSAVALITFIIGFILYKLKIPLIKIFGIGAMVGLILVSIQKFIL